MYIKPARKKLTDHSRARLEERGIDPASVSAANHYGLDPEDLPLASATRDFMAKRAKRAKLYKGNVYVFFKHSDKLVTAFPLPAWLMIDYDAWGCREMEKRKKQAWKEGRIATWQRKREG